jgi:TatD DNase family protein
MLVDSHCHLDFPDYAGERDAVVARAREAGVGTILTISTKLTTFDLVRDIAERFEGLYCTVGVHPHEAGAEPQATDTGRLIELSGHPKVIGFGETGLDYYYEHSVRERQKAAFRAHLEAARQAGLPVVVHTRDADRDIMGILREMSGKGELAGVIHCFAASRELAECALELGFYISFSGIVTFKKADALRDIAREVPLDRLLVETDAPYLAPVPYRGKRNEPAFVVHTAEAVAAALGLPPEAVAEATTENFFRLFAKAKKPAPPCA